MAELIIENLRKSYKKKVVVKDISLNVKSGEVVGLLGPNGAGKTTSFYMIVGLVAAENGIIKIDQNELRIDTFRASGAGGQHVNKTDSAIRITHIPSGIVVQCQNQRSQHKNKASALKVLKARLYQVEVDKEKEAMKNLENSKMDNAGGSQIRSYVFHPYNLVKDHRTKEESGNVTAIMDGNIDKFIRAYLMNQLGKNIEK